MFFLLSLFSKPQAGLPEKDMSGTKGFLSYLKQAISCSLLRCTFVRLLHRVFKMNLGAVKLS